MLFNKNNTGEDEVKRILGFTFYNNVFDNLVASILQVEERIIQLIGPEIFTRAQTRYEANDFNPELTSTEVNDQLVHKIQFANLFLAYREYARNNDVQHSDKGRVITVSENEKPAFEWMIERDDRALLDKSYAFLDGLLNFLELKADTFTEWKNSNARKQFRAQLIYSVDQFEEQYRIGRSMRFFLLVLPQLRKVEKRHIKSVIGETRYTALLTKIKDGGTLDAADKALLEMIAPPLVYYTMVDALCFYAEDEFPSCVIQSYLPDSQNRRKNGDNKTILAKRINEEADSYHRDLQEYIRKLDQQADFVSQPILPENSPDNKFFST